MTNLAIFASGKGTNAEAIIKHFRNHTDVKIPLIVSNNPHSGAIEMAKSYGIDTLVIDKQGFYNSTAILKELERKDISYIVLAGFLWLLPQYLLDEYPGKIINIHPALLPKYGGKGMYGKRVHEEVLKAKEKVSGITIHYVNSNYDEGEIIFQASCPVKPDDDIASLEAKVQKLEHLHYPEVIEQLLIKETVTND